MIRWVSAQAYQDRLEPREWRRITATFTLVALPLFFFLPGTLAALLAVALAMKFVAIVRGDERLAITVALGLMLIGGMTIYGQLRTQGLTLSFVALLVTMSVCKLLESRNRRDVHVLFLLETLLMLAFLMFSQSILISSICSLRWPSACMVWCALSSWGGRGCNSPAGAICSAFSSSPYPLPRRCSSFSRASSRCGGCHNRARAQ